ncbi:MAG: ABC transporter permease subunit, partial [Acidimicrobiales bacterium]
MQPTRPDNRPLPSPPAEPTGAGAAIAPATEPVGAGHAGEAAAAVLGPIEAPAIAGSFGEYLGALGKQVRSGESGVLPVLAGLVFIVLIFQFENGVFLSPKNLVNLLVQAATYVFLGMAEVFVLLLGEIDLSLGYVAAIGAVITLTTTGTGTNWPWWAGILAGLAGTALIGAVQGLLITRLRLPSFVVTLAGLLGFEGVVIYL